MPMGKIVGILILCALVYGCHHGMTLEIAGVLNGTTSIDGLAGEVVLGFILALVVGFAFGKVSN